MTNYLTQDYPHRRVSLDGESYCFQRAKGRVHFSFSNALWKWACEKTDSGTLARYERSTNLFQHQQPFFYVTRQALALPFTVSISLGHSFNCEATNFLLKKELHQYLQWLELTFPLFCHDETLILFFLKKEKSRSQSIEIQWRDFKGWFYPTNYYVCVDVILPWVSVHTQHFVTFLNRCCMLLCYLTSPERYQLYIAV